MRITRITATLERLAATEGARGYAGLEAPAVVRCRVETEDGLGGSGVTGRFLAGQVCPLLAEGFDAALRGADAREIARLVAHGALGEPLQLAFRLRPGDGQGPRAYLDRQPYFQTLPRFLVHETAVHLLDVFRFLFGMPEAVFADLRRLNPAIAGEDAGLIILRYADGRRAVFDGNRLVDHAAANPRLTMGELLAEGTAGTLRLDGAGRLWRRARGAADEREHGYDRPAQGYGGDCVFALQRHVIAHLTQGAAVENRARDYLATLRLVEACYASAEQGRWMVV
ncbi:MAG: Gfo/Idh/MocA family oxidoreductase [Elioraea tepidiphila]